MHTRLLDCEASKHTLANTEPEIERDLKLTDTACSVAIKGADWQLGNHAGQVATCDS